MSQKREPLLFSQ